VHDPRQLLAGLARQIEIGVERGEAKIFVHVKRDCPFCARKGHAAEQTKFRIDEMILDPLHQGRRHRANPIGLELGR